MFGVSGRNFEKTIGDSSAFLRRFGHSRELFWRVSGRAGTLSIFAVWGIGAVLRDFVLIFPFCSKKHIQKKWPYFSELIIKLKEIYKNKYPVLVAPGPDEIVEAKKLNAKIVLENNKAIKVDFLISLINSISKPIPEPITKAFSDTNNGLPLLTQYNFSGSSTFIINNPHVPFNLFKHV